MLNKKSIEEVEKSLFSTHFCKPLYGSYCFSEIPATIKSLFGKPSTSRLPLDTTEGAESAYDVVFLFLIDGFGWRFFEKYQDKYPFLKRFIKEGVVSKITSQFPSTTAAHITTINTGQCVGQTGVYEWFYYEPKVDRIISPLLFSFGEDKEPGTLKQTNIDPKEFYPERTIYQDLKELGVSSFAVQHKGIAHSPYSNVMLQGASQVPYSTLNEGLKRAARLARSKEKGPTYIYFYFGNIDAAGHRHGIDSPQFEKAVDDCFSSLETQFFEEIVKCDKKVACLLTADHGMVHIDPKTTFYLNERLPEILPLIKKNKAGEPIVPAGSSRDFFLHIEEIHLEKAYHFLKEKLVDIAEVHYVKELIDAGFFGKEPCSEVFLNRVGNLVILPFEHESVWWHERHRYDQHFYGAHGGLTKHELETIFLFQEIVPSKT